MALTFYKWTTPQFWYSDLFSIQQVRGTGTNMLKLSPLRSSAQSDPYNNGNNQFTNYFNTSYQCHCVIKHNSHNNPKFQIFASPHGNPRALGNQGWWLPKWHKFLANHAATRSYQKKAAHIAQYTQNTITTTFKNVSWGSTKSSCTYIQLFYFTWSKWGRRKTRKWQNLTALATLQKMAPETTFTVIQITWPGINRMRQTRSWICQWNRFAAG